MRPPSRTPRSAPPSSVTTRVASGRRPSSGTHAGQRRPAPRTASTILGGGVVMVSGLAWAIGLSLSGGTGGAHEHALILLLLPWLVVAAGAGLGIYGLARTSAAIR